MTQLLEVEDLVVQLSVNGTQRSMIHRASLRLSQGEMLGLVGESGSGKSLTARAIARLLPSNATIAGRIAFEGDSVYEMSRADLRSYRTSGVAMIFQDPKAHINPVRSTGDFLTEALRTNLGLSRDEATARILDALSEIGVTRAEARLRQYPHELSGGLLQRMMIAAALAVRPRMLLADEPTTALDVTTQADVMALLDRLRHEHDLGVLFITHDLELATAVCDRIAVIYAGMIVEEIDADRLHTEPRHPYTAALVAARPDPTRAVRRLATIPGRPLAGFEAPPGCVFAARCQHVEPACELERPSVITTEGGFVRCRRADHLRERLALAVRPTPSDA